MTSRREAVALAKAARAEAALLAELRAAAKSTPMFTAIKTATLAEIDAWVDVNFSGLTVAQRRLLKLLAAVAGLYLRERK